MTQAKTTRTPAQKADQSGPSYSRFAAMIATSMVVMFILLYFNTFSWDHVQWSETRFYMTFMMGAAMAGIMLSFMLNMYRSRMINIAIFVVSFLVLVGALWLVRSQETVQDRSYMSAMIPHHSIAILTSERSEISDMRGWRWGLSKPNDARSPKWNGSLPTSQRTGPPNLRLRPPPARSPNSAEPPPEAVTGDVLHNPIAGNAVMTVIGDWARWTVAGKRPQR